MDDQQVTPQDPLSVRVDLTSQDLRTGTIRLPRQLHGQFPAGRLTASGLDTDQPYLLDSEPPSKLSGLQPFMDTHDLRTNDAVVIHVDGRTLRLQPYYRRPTQPAEPGVAESETSESDADGVQGPDLPPAFTPQKTVGQQPEVVASPGESAEASADLLAEDTDSFQSAFDSFDAFDSLSELGELEPDDFGLGEPELPADSGGIASQTAGSVDGAAGTVEVSEYHAVQRRPFGKALLNTVSRQTAPATSFPQSSQQNMWEVPAGDSMPGPDMDPANADTGARSHPDAQVQVSSERAIIDFLNSPNAPSILNVKDVARQLGQEEAAVEASLESLASSAASRVSRVRPGFYLLKRQRAE